MIPSTLCSWRNKNPVNAVEMLKMTCKSKSFLTVFGPLETYLLNRFLDSLDETQTCDFLSWLFPLAMSTPGPPPSFEENN